MRDIWSMDCPFCGVAITLATIRWRCPCCGAETANWDPMSVCVTCGFPPAYFDCPSCACGIDIGEIWGTRHASDGSRILPRARPQLNGGMTYQLTQLPLFQAGSLVQDKSWGLAIEVIVPELENLTFSFPFPVRSHEMLSGRAASDGRRWLHFYLYADADARNDQKVGLLSICASPAPDGGGFSVKVAVVEALPGAEAFL